MERDIEKDLIEIECAIKSQREKENIFTMSVLQRCYKLVSELQNYRCLEEQGKLLKLPCSVGDVVYEIGSPEDPIEKKKIDSIEICDSGVCIYAKGISGPFEKYDITDFGEIVFLTRRKAEAALKVN